MNRNQFYQYIESIGHLDEESLANLRELLVEYPFFQAARILYVKNLNRIDHIRYQHELKLASVHISDRKKLYRLIHFDLPQESDKEANASSTPKTAVHSIRQDAPLQLNENYFNVTDQVETPGETIDFSSKKYNTGKTRAASDETVLADNDFEFGLGPMNQYQLNVKPLDPTKSLSFIEWLNAVSMAPSIQNRDDKENIPDDRQKNLIDSFLGLGKEKIIPGSHKEHDIVDISASSILEKDELMTETLANIHIKQKHFEKAIIIFEKLSLKYPEKNIYFASRIKEVEKLISNQ